MVMYWTVSSIIKLLDKYFERAENLKTEKKESIFSKYNYININN